MDSVWMVDRDEQAFPPLRGSGRADTVVIGGGITGVTAALLLNAAGHAVTLLEAGAIAGSNTGGSTGNLYGTVSSGLAVLRDKWGDDVTREVVAVRRQAVNLIEDTVDRFGIECAFARRPLHVCVADGNTEQLDALDDEYAASEAAGLEPARLDGVPELPFEVRRAVRIEGQAQFNPYRYARGVARALAAAGVGVHEFSPVVDVDAGEGLVRTDAGEVHAAHLVFATHTPKGVNLVQAEMETYREYGISAPLERGDGPDGIYWVRDHGRSIRSYRSDGRRYLVVVGEMHKTGRNEPGVDYLDRLRRYASEHFGSSEFPHAWSAQQYRPADGLPYIGSSAHDNVYIATGFAADGLTWGTVAAEVIAELIAGRDSRVSELLTPRRFTPVKSAGIWASETATAVGGLVADRLSAAELETLDAVRKGEGRMVDVDGEKRAVYRSPTNELSVLSPICPHLKCQVAWNGAAGSWDCPCHGSRFDPDGHVIEGPALKPLSRVDTRSEGP